MIIHVVAQGETLNSIAARYNVSREQIIRDNQLRFPDQLVVGQTLVILRRKLVHTVGFGDSLFSIANKYSVSVMNLLQNNPWLTNRELVIGETVVISYDVTKNTTLETNGYAYQYINRSLLRSVLPYLTRLTIFGYGFTAEGELVYTDDTELIALAYEFQAIPIMLISSITAEGNFSSENASLMFKNPAAQSRLIENLLNVMKEKGYLGIDIDFEFIEPEDRQNYINFVRRITNAMHANGFSVNIDLAPKTSAMQRGLLYESHDYAALGAIADTVLLMTYEWGYTYGPPMAVAPIPQVRKVLDYAVTAIPENKIFMGIPNYAYDWPLPYIRNQTAAETIGNETAVDIAREYVASISYDESAKAPYFYYRNLSGQEHVVWFEDARSIREKLLLIQEYNLKGPGYWNVMRQFTQNWFVLNSMFYIVKRL